MSETPLEVRTANLIYLVVWVVLVGSILLFGQRWERTRGIRERIIDGWKFSLAIAITFVMSLGIAGRGFINLHGITVFCQAMIGLALARGITNFEATPVMRAFIQRDKPWLKLGVNILIAVMVVIPAVMIGTIGLDIGQQIFGESNYTDQATESFPLNLVQAFFMLLGGAGIAEETPFRLVFLSFFWLITGRRKLSILIAAILFGAYHLSPLNGMYQVFLQFPFSQFLASTLIGIVWGILFVKRGYGSAVLAHTLSNWLPLIIFGGS